MHCGRATRSYGVVLCAALLALPALVDGGGPVEPSKERSAVPITEQEFADSVNEEFSLRESSLFTLEVSATAGTTIRMTVPIEGRQRTMVLKHHTIRAPGYQLLMQVADGALVSVEPGPERTLRGVIEDMPGSVVAASLEDAGIQAVVRCPDGEQYWIEPLAGKVVAALPGEHVIYRASDSLHEHDGSCGCLSATVAALAATAKPMRLESGIGPATTATAAIGGPAVAELACDADFEYFVSRGGSVLNVESRINSIMNAVNIQYERDVNITHQITTIVVRTDVNDPYTATNTELVVNEFRAEWNATMNHIQRDVAQLFTAREIDGGTIGQAFTIGGVCNLNQAYCYVQSDFANGGIFHDATDLSAHELGHLWNGLHCSCTNPDFTMNPGITGANQFQPIDTIPSIQGYRSTSMTAHCLDNRQPPPVNDVCVDATSVCAGTVFGSTDWADSEGIRDVPGEEDCDFARTSPDVWYSYTPAIDGELIVDTCSEIWDTVLAIHDGCPDASAIHFVDCNDDSRCGPGPSTRQSLVSVNVTAGTTYYIRVTGWNSGWSPSGPAEDFELNITGPPCEAFCGDGNCDVGEDRCICTSDCGSAPVTELACDDGIDNDCDSLTDCDDSDCLTAPACSCVPTEALETICDDGVDNDCDGLIDCDDLDACGPRPVGPCVVGDANCDGDADQADFLALLDDFGGPGVTTVDCSPFDVDGDLDLDLFDVAGFQTAFTAIK